MNALETSTGETFIPTKDMERPPCPFYGFLSLDNSMVDGRKNQCALMVRHTNPCYMELNRDQPNWNKCKYQTSESESRIGREAENVRVHTREFDHAEINLIDWMNYILSKK